MEQIKEEAQRLYIEILRRVLGQSVGINWRIENSLMWVIDRLNRMLIIKETESLENNANEKALLNEIFQDIYFTLCK